MRTDSDRTVDGMNPLSRRTTLQTGLAAVGVLGAVAVSLGLANNHHTSTAAQDGSAHQRAHATARSSESDDDTARSKPAQAPSVSAPQTSAPQATTSGS
jgi:hypothetical protein